MSYMDVEKAYLDEAQNYADIMSTCTKVKVGSVIVNRYGEEVYGCNHGVHNCKKNGCRRIELYGNASKEHRLPSDCDALHSEIDAICRAASQNTIIQGATIFVTRYPCEACARAIAASGIRKVVYGRKEEISEYTKEILLSRNVMIQKIDDWEREDNNE